MIYAFAFPGNMSKSVLYKLKTVDHCYIVWPNNIEHYLNILTHDQPEFVLGLGVYSGIDQDKIWIETQATNKFRNNPIDPSFSEAEILPLNTFLEPDANSKFASGLGNSWCNLISWKITTLINQKVLKSHYTFLHIPNSFSAPQITKVTEGLLNKFMVVTKKQNKLYSRIRRKNGSN